MESLLCRKGSEIVVIATMWGRTQNTHNLLEQNVENKRIGGGPERENTQNTYKHPLAVF